MPGMNTNHAWYSGPSSTPYDASDDIKPWRDEEARGGFLGIVQAPEEVFGGGAADGVAWTSPSACGVRSKNWPPTTSLQQGSSSE